MARKKDRKRGQKKHAKLLKRRKKRSSRVARSSKKPPLQPAAEPTQRPEAETMCRTPKAFSVWDPANRFGKAVHYPVLEHLPGPGPALIAIPFDGDRIALYPRSDDGSYGPAPLVEIPIDQQVTWVDAPVPVREADLHHVTWLDEPTLEGDALRGTIVVHILVDGELGSFWSPRVAVEVERRGAELYDLHADVIGGVLSCDGLEIEWGSDNTHAEALAEFLKTQEKLLWRMLHGGQGIDPAWRVNAISGLSPRYKRWAVEDLVHQANEVVPHLIAILDAVLRGVRDSNDLGPLYALSLLAHLGTHEVHDTLLALARLDADDFEEVFGAYLTDQFDAALLKTARGELGGIRELLLDRDADGYLRSQAANALAGATELGQADREVVLALLASQLNPDASSDPYGYVWTGIGSTILDLHGVEYEEQLIEAIENGLIEPMAFDEDYVREVLHGDTPLRVDFRCLDLVRTDDVHQWIGWWACFKDRGTG